VVPIPAARPNFPLKAREALACGIPLLVTENDSARELRDIAPGFLIPDNSPRSIAEGIERVLNDPGTPDASRRAREFILGRYSWDTAMERVVAVIDRIRNA